MEGQVIEVAAVCKGNSEKVCTEDFDQDIERIKLLQRKLYSLKEALAMFWDYHFFQHSVPLPSRCSLIFNVWWPACLPSLQAQISSKSLSFKRRHSWEVVHLAVEVFHLFEFPIFLHHCYNIHKKSQLRRLTLLSDKDTWPGASEIVSKVIGQHLTRGE